MGKATGTDYREDHLGIRTPLPPVALAISEPPPARRGGDGSARDTSPKQKWYSYTPHTSDQPEAPLIPGARRYGISFAHRNPTL